MSVLPVRVAHLVLQLDVGGMEKLLIEFGRHADRRRVELHFVCLGQRGKLADEIEACGWPVTALDVPPGLRPGIIMRLARVFRQWRANVVHTHNTKPLLYGAPAARLAGVSRIFHTRHGQRFAARGWQTAAFRLASSLTTRLVCVSNDSARLSAAEGVSRSRIVTIRNGIDVGRFAYAGPTDGGPAVMVGRLSSEKDVATLVEAAALAVRQCPTFRLEIAGDGACLEDLQRQSAALGLGEHVRFLGEVRDIPALLARASLFVLPSLTEGISLTLLEAMARGLPVVATRVGGNPEVVADNATGLLVEAKTPAALADAMLRLLAEPAVARRMGMAGRTRVEQLFDVRRMVREYEELYLHEW